MFCNVSKIVLCGRRNTFATFSQDKLQFSWQAQHFGRVQRHFAWQAQHFRRVVLRVFCESHCQGCVKWRQGANSVAARNIDFEVANLEVPKKTRRKTSILKLQSEEISHDAPMCLVSPCLWGKLQNLSFSKVSKQPFAWQARHFVTFQPV